MEIVPVNSASSWWKMQEKFSPSLPDLENSGLNHEILSTHAPVSVTELFALTDPHKIADIYSSPVVYIATFENQKPKFKKVQTKTNETFSCDRGGYFVQLSSNVQRHFERINGVNLTLVETCLWFELLEKKAGDEIYECYKGKVEKIPRGEVIGLDGDPYPTYILCSNGQLS